MQAHRPFHVYVYVDGSFWTCRHWPTYELARSFKVEQEAEGRTARIEFAATRHSA